MKTFGFLLFTAVLLGGFSAPAQVPGGSQPGVNAVLLQLFGNATAFSAKIDVRMLDERQKESMSTAMDFALLNGNMRIELEMSKMKSKELPAETIGQFKTLGMDKMVTIVRPDKKEALLVYPALQS